MLISNPHPVLKEGACSQEAAECTVVTAFTWCEIEITETSEQTTFMVIHF